jgi:hypothetical protein
MPTETDAGELIRRWNNLSLPERIKAFNKLPRGLTDNVFLSLGTDEQLELIEHLPKMNSGSGCGCSRRARPPTSFNRYRRNSGSSYLPSWTTPNGVK